jgi:phage baseplate assembly protein W
MAIYSDVNQYSPTQRALVSDLDSIYQSIGNILGTSLRSRFFLPEFGSAIEELLFEPMDELTVAALYDTIVIAIQKWEPRVDLDYSKSSITPDYDKHTYYVSLTFTVRGLSDSDFYTYSGTLYKNR